MSNAIAVDVKALSKKFGEFTAVDRVTFQVGRGEIFGFLGPNGSGKTTTIRMLCGVLLPSGGNARVLDFDIRKQSAGVHHLPSADDFARCAYCDDAVGGRRMKERRIRQKGDARRLGRPKQGAYEAFGIDDPRRRGIDSRNGLNGRLSPVDERAIHEFEILEAV